MSKKIVFENGNLSLSCSLNKVADLLSLSIEEYDEPIKGIGICLDKADAEALLETLAELTNKMENPK